MKWSAVRTVCLLLAICSVGCISARKQRKKDKQVSSSTATVEQADIFNQSVFDDKELRLLSGDHQSKKNTKSKHKQSGTLTGSSIGQQEAKLSDIPIPFHTTPMTKSQEQKGEDFVLHYESRMSLDEIKQFYDQQMERLGWQQVTAFNGAETLLNFKKPDRVCAISIRPKKRTADLVIFVTNVS